MILSTRQFREKVSRNALGDVIAVSTSGFREESDWKSFKLSFELITKHKLFKKVNSFCDEIGSDYRLDTGAIHPVLLFLMGDHQLTDVQIKAFFELEKEFFQFEGKLIFNLSYNPSAWDFSYHAHAAILGVPLDMLETLDRGGQNHVVEAYEKFGDLVCDYLEGDLKYEDFLSKAKVAINPMHSSNLTELKKMISGNPTG